MKIFDLFCFRDLDLDLDPMTFIIRTWTVFLVMYRMCKYELPTLKLSTVIVWHTDRQTDRPVTRDHFWSCGIDGTNIIGSAITENPIYTLTSWLYLLWNQSYGRSKFSLHCGSYFRLSFALVTLTWPYDFYVQTWPIATPWRYNRCANMNFLLQGFRKLSSDRQTDTTEIIYHTASRAGLKT